MVDGRGSGGKAQAVTTRISKPDRSPSSSNNTESVFKAPFAILSIRSNAVMEGGGGGALLEQLLDCVSLCSPSLSNSARVLFSFLVHLFLEDLPLAVARSREVIQ